jgi:hypothetical protein
MRMPEIVYTHFQEGKVFQYASMIYTTRLLSLFRNLLTIQDLEAPLKKCMKVTLFLVPESVDAENY